MAPSSYQDVLKLAKDNKVQFIDLKFIASRAHGSTTHCRFKELADLFENGNGFDGSSIRGFRPIHESDMLLFADPDHLQIHDRPPAVLSPGHPQPDLRCQGPMDGKITTTTRVTWPEKRSLPEDYRHCRMSVTGDRNWNSSSSTVCLRYQQP